MGAIKNFLSDIKNIKLDKQKFAEWQEFFSVESQDPKSDFNAFRMTLSEDKRQISYVLNIPENYQMATSDAAKYQKLVELVQPVNRYLYKAGWGEYAPYYPQFLYVESELDETGKPINNEESCTYIAVWEFEPKVLNDSSFWGKFASFIGINAAIIGAVVTAICLI